MTIPNFAVIQACSSKPRRSIKTSCFRSMIGKWMVFFFNYDSTMSMVYLTTVPVLSLFMLQVEISFFVHYQRFYGVISTHVSLDRINRNHKALLNNMIKCPSTNPAGHRLCHCQLYRHQRYLSSSRSIYCRLEFSASMSLVRSSSCWLNSSVLSWLTSTFGRVICQCSSSSSRRTDLIISIWLTIALASKGMDVFSPV